MHGQLTLVLLLLIANNAPTYERFSEAKCARIDQQIQRIHSQMRAGYTAKRGVRLEARLRELKLKRARHCR